MPDLHGSIRDWWDADAHHYDRSVGHSISDPVEAAAWRAALRRLLPALPSRVLDVGAGTGSLSLLAAELGRQVTALDLSEGMLDRARVKAEERGTAISFVVGTAESPPEGPFDAVIVEGIDRLSRMTADATRIERELEQLDIGLFATDEPMVANATVVLTRRVKQGVAECTCAT